MRSVAIPDALRPVALPDAFPFTNPMPVPIIASIDGVVVMTECRLCGCTPLRACVDAAGQPCSWITPDLCSACLEVTA